jgi:C-terminal processing protease CtpA/Prc
MRKVSIVVLIAAILAGVIFVAFHSRRHVQPSITGIGVELLFRPDKVEIIGVLPDTPAAKAGLHTGLIVQQINGTNILGKPPAMCVAMMRGPVGSKVQIEVIDTAKSTTNIVEFTRAKIPVRAGHGTVKGLPVKH